MNHRIGQYRAQLFEEIVGCLLARMFSRSKIRPNFAVPKAWLELEASKRVVDFFIREPSGSTVLVETKAPYDQDARIISKTLDDLYAFLRHWQKSPNRRFIIAVAADIPPSTVLSFQSDAALPQLELWDASKINDLLMTNFVVKAKTFSAEEMVKVLTQIRSEASKSVCNDLGAGFEGESRLGEGIHEKVVVLCADFCSYSKFVRASGDDHELVAAIMRRFYRDTRRAIVNHGGFVDKYMGDGILAFWMPRGEGGVLASTINSCIHELIGIGLKLAEEWQMHVDSTVNPTGMTCGAAIGTVQLISENQDGLLPLHAVGDAINMAARLQAEAKPNTLIISNKLKTACFPKDNNFVEIRRNPKNIGEVGAWERDYLTATDSSLMASNSRGS